LSALRLFVSCEPEALAIHLQDVNMVGQPVGQCRCD